MPEKWQDILKRAVKETQPKPFQQPFDYQKSLLKAWLGEDPKPATEFHVDDEFEPVRIIFLDEVNAMSEEMRRAVMIFTDGHERAHVEGA